MDTFYQKFNIFKSHLKRALLEVISSGVATTEEDINNFVHCTLLCAQNELMASEEKTDGKRFEDNECIAGALDFLIEYEFVRLQNDENTRKQYYVSTQLGNACLGKKNVPFFIISRSKAKHTHKTGKQEII